MTTWNVHVRGAGIAAGVQLDICLDGLTHDGSPCRPWRRVTD